MRKQYEDSSRDDRRAGAGSKYEVERPGECEFVTGQRLERHAQNKREIE